MNSFVILVFCVVSVVLADNYGVQVKFSEAGFLKVLSPITQTVSDTIRRITIPDQSNILQLGNIQHTYTLKNARLTSVGTVSADVKYVELSSGVYGANVTFSIDNIGLFYKFSLSEKGNKPTEADVDVAITAVKYVFTLQPGENRMKDTLVVTDCSVDFESAAATTPTLIIQLLLNQVIQSERQILLDQLATTYCPRMELELKRKTEQYFTIAENIKPTVCGQSLKLNYGLEEIMINQDSVTYNAKAAISPRALPITDQDEPVFFAQQADQDVQIIFTQPLISRFLQNTSCEEIFVQNINHQQVSDGGNIDIVTLVNTSNTIVDASSHGISITMTARVELIKSGTEDRVIMFDLKLQRYFRIKYSAQKIEFIVDSWVMDQVLDKSQEEVDNQKLCKLITDYGEGVIKSATDSVYEIPLEDFVRDNGLKDVDISFPDGNLVVNADVADTSSTDVKEMRIANRVYSNKIVIGDRLEKSVQTCGTTHIFLSAILYVVMVFTRFL